MDSKLSCVYMTDYNDSESWMKTAPEQDRKNAWAARLMNGQITLAEYAGLSKKELYVIAQQAYQLLQTGRLEESRTIYQGLVAADPYDSVFRCHLGSVLLRSGNQDEALKQFNFALQYNIANVDAMVGRGEIYFMRGEIENAVKDFQKAVELDSEIKRDSTTRAQAALLSIKNAIDKQRTANQSLEDSK